MREALFLLSGILWDADFTESLRDLILGEDNILDSPRNMICLQPGLHRWWHNGYIAFEPVAELSNGVRVRLRWLGVSGLVPSDRRLLDTDPRGCLTTPLEVSSIHLRDFWTGRLLTDGVFFNITASNPDNAPSYGLLKLQWDLMRFVAISGIAGTGHSHSISENTGAAT